MAKFCFCFSSFHHYKCTFYAWERCISWYVLTYLTMESSIFTDYIGLFGPDLRMFCRNISPLTLIVSACCQVTYLLAGLFCLCVGLVWEDVSTLLWAVCAAESWLHGIRITCVTGAWLVQCREGGAPPSRKFAAELLGRNSNTNKQKCKKKKSQYAFVRVNQISQEGWECQTSLNVCLKV